MAITLTVTHVNGDAIIEAEPFWKVGFIKVKAVERIEKLDMINGMALHDLVKEGQVLSMKDSVEECNIQDGDVLILERKHGTITKI